MKLGDQSSHDGSGAVTTRAARPSEHLYYTSTTGHVFAAPNSRFSRIRLPWYGQVSLALNDSSMKVIAGRQTFEGFAMAFHARDVKFIAESSRFISVAFNPLHEDFRAFASLAPQILPIDRSVFAQFASLGEQAVNGSISHEDARRLFDGVADVVRPLLPAVPKLDQRAEILVRELWANPGSSVNDLAERLGLSYYRTSHLFAHAVGLPVRKYQLWQKLYRSGAPLIRGASLTEAAHAAGFVDSAHYSRVFQQAYGLSPSEIFCSPNFTIHATNRVCDARSQSDPLDSSLEAVGASDPLLPGSRNRVRRVRM